MKDITRFLDIFSLNVYKPELQLYSGQTRLRRSSYSNDLFKVLNILFIINRVRTGLILLRGGSVNDETMTNT